MIEVENVSKIYKVAAAVKNVSIRLERGEILGLVGESGCGKSTLGRMLLGLIPPTSGKIRFDGQPVIKPVPAKMQMIFQDPFSSLNPRMAIGDIIGEPLSIHNRSLPTVDELLDLVGLPINAKGRFPHEFSGGQRQRVGIARALALHPDFIVCDEPVSSLDVSIAAQIINLLHRLHKELNLTYLFIAHDLAMVRHISTRIAVMYRGEFVETAPADVLFERPSHPYTRLLLASIPKSGAQAPRPASLPSIGNQGCPFAARCSHAEMRCFMQKPELKEVEQGHFAACHLVQVGETKSVLKITGVRSCDFPEKQTQNKMG